MENKENSSINKISNQNKELTQLTAKEALKDLCLSTISPLKDYFAALENAMEFDPNCEVVPYGYELLGDHYLALEDYPKAAKCYATMLELSGDEYYSESFFRRGAQGLDEKSLLEFFESPRFRGPNS
jgi:hypothetical protein